MSEDAQPSNTPHAGEILRAARENAGLHLATLAATLKVPMQRLDALENGRFNELPDATFTRALAASVCRVLKIDAAPVLNQLPQNAQVRLAEAKDEVKARFPSERSGGMPGWSATGAFFRSSKALITMVLVLLTAAAAWFALPEWDAWVDVDTPSQTVTNEQPAAVSEASSATVSPNGVEAPSQATQVAPALPIAASDTVPEAPAMAVASPASALLELTMKQSSWVQVKGAKGQTIFERIVPAGEVVTIREESPLNVVIGNASTAEVRVRGEPKDLQPFVRNNVARFQVE